MLRINHVRWDITGYCNLNCKHCQAMGYYETNKCKSRDLSFENICVIIDKLEKLNVVSIGILGGEPLVRPDIFKILEYIKSKKIRVVLNTNGILITENTVTTILKYCDSIIVSLDGVTPDTHDKLRGLNSFSKAIHGIKLLSKYKSSKNRIGISYVINNFNYQQVTDLSKFCNNLNLDVCLVDSVHETGNAIENWNLLSISDDTLLNALINLIHSWDFKNHTKLDLRMYTNLFREKIIDEYGVVLPKRYIHDAPGISSLYLLNDGTVLPNQFLAYLENGNKFKSYSLLDKSFEQIISSNDFSTFLNLYETRDYLKKYTPCNECKYMGKECQLSPVPFVLKNYSPVRICNILAGTKKRGNQ